MTNNIVQEWFQEHYHQLPPFIQIVHHKGSTLQGYINIILGKGISGINGKLLERKLSVPQQGEGAVYSFNFSR